MTEQETKAKEVFLREYDGSGTFGRAADIASRESGMVVKDNDGYIIDRVFLWAAEKDGWMLAGAIGTTLVLICPKCGGDCPPSEVFVHRQQHAEQNWLKGGEYEW